MLCDTCAKATVCRLKEDCNRLEQSIKGNHVEDILSVNIKCKEYQFCNQTAFKNAQTIIGIFPKQPSCAKQEPFDNRRY